LRANDVHDSSVRRIDTITPDIVAPDRTNLRAATPVARESNDNTPTVTPAVRVQIVNAKAVPQKCRARGSNPRRSSG
jgi:hypothetical protein